MSYSEISLANSLEVSRPGEAFGDVQPAVVALDGLHIAVRLHLIHLDNLVERDGSRDGEGLARPLAQVDALRVDAPPARGGRLLRPTIDKPAYRLDVV